MSRMPQNTTQPDCASFCLANRVIFNFLVPPLWTIGLIGNLLIVLVFSTSRTLRRRKPVLCITMITLAIADALVFLFPITRHWFRQATYIQYDVQKISRYGCKFHEFMVYYSLMFSTWMVVLVAGERFTIICFPLRRSRLLTTRRISCIIAAMAAVGALVNCHFFWTREFVFEKRKGVYNCKNSNTGFYGVFIQTIFPNVDMVLSVALPFVLLLLFNALIVHRLYQRSHQLKAIASGFGDQSRRRLVTPTTRMLLPVPLVFIPLALPVKIWLMIYGTGLPRSTPKDKEDLVRFRWSCLLFLQFCNFASNFFIYSLMSTDFRADLARLFCRLCKGRSKQPSLAATATLGTVSNAGRCTQQPLHSFVSRDDISSVFPLGKPKI